MRINFVEEGKEMSDDEIISRIKDNNFEYLQPLIDKYMPLIISTAKSFENSGVETEDLIAEGIVTVFSAVKSYDAKKSKFSTFLSVCLKRAMITQTKSLSAQKRIPGNLISSIDDVELKGENSPEDIFIDKESYNSFKENILEELSNMELKVLNLFLEGNSYAEISQKLSISPKSVDNSLNRIRNKIKKFDFI